VIENQYGGLQDAFSVCFSIDPNKAPSCDWTAHVVFTDPERDAALLQINALDIYGNSIDFSSLSILTVDSAYDPNTNDAVTALGYPGI